MERVAHPPLPWEDDKTNELLEIENTSGFDTAHDVMITVLNHQMNEFNQIILERIAIDSVVSYKTKKNLLNILYIYCFFII